MDKYLKQYCSKFMQFLIVIALVVSLIMAANSEARSLSEHVVVGCSSSETRFANLRTMLPKEYQFTLERKKSRGEAIQKEKTVKMKLFSTKFFPLLQQNRRNHSASGVLLSSLFSNKTQTQTQTQTITQSSPSKALYDRIQTIRDPKISVIPVLDKWVGEGNTVDTRKLHNLVRVMKEFKRFHHALEISQWMTDRCLALSSSDVALRKGLIEKAESALNKAVEGRKPYASSWNVLAIGYVEQNQMLKAVEMLKRATSVGRGRWLPTSVTLDPCLDFLEGKGDVVGIEDIIKSLKKPLTRDIYHRWLRTCVAAGGSVSEVLDQMELDGFSVDEETEKILKTGQSL
ncbi:hypothetical protein QYF36_021892 [Acer negundo]|nr:hypothetical protein QYF36_021892 [Acer negundo]